MAIKTKIQWCDSTINPVMGCDGCELWPTIRQLMKVIRDFIESLANDATEEGGADKQNQKKKGS